MARVAKNLKSLFLTVLLGAFALGCGGGTGDGYTGPRGQVSGKVTLDDQPLKSGCQVLFVSTKGGYTAGGVIKDGGVYTLAYKESAGMPIGEYQVQLTAPIVPASTEVVDPSKMQEKLKLGADSKGGEDSGPFPSKYASTNTSLLSFPVKAGPNTADFKLEKK